jgi:hypothetical protein
LPPATLFVIPQGSAVASLPPTTLFVIPQGSAVASLPLATLFVIPQGSAVASLPPTTLFVIPQGSAVASLPPATSTTTPKRARPAAISCRSRTSGATISRARVPDKRTTPIPPRPTGVEIATIVSCSIAAIPPKTSVILSVAKNPRILWAMMLKSHPGCAIDRPTTLFAAGTHGTSAEFWLNLQAAHDLSRIRRESGRAIQREVEPFEPEAIAA